MQPHQRSAYYGASPPDQPSGPPSSAPHPQRQQHHYRRPSSPGPYGNPPQGYSSAPPPPSSSSSSSAAAGAHYSQSQAYGRHDYKDEYYGQDHRREYEPVDPSHGRDYAAPIARDLYQSPSSASPSRLHRPPREAPPGPSAARHGPSSASPGGYAPHHAPYPAASSTRDQDHLPSRSPPVHRPSGHPYSGSSTGNVGRYSARSPSPAPYGSPPGGLTYRQYYEQQQQQHNRPIYRQEYYASDGEGEAAPMGQHSAYHHSHPPPHGHPSSRMPAFRSYDGPAHDYPPGGSHPSSFYPPQRRSMQSDRYESSGPVSAPPRATSPFQPYAARHPTHSGHPAPGGWSATRSPELETRSAIAYRRRSASVDEGMERDKLYYAHPYHHPAARHPSRSPPPPRGRSPARYQYNSSPYGGAPSGYNEATYIPSRSPSPVRLAPLPPQRAGDRKAQVTSIAQLLIEKSSREASPDYNVENGSMAPSPRQSSGYRHNNVHDRQRPDLSPTPPPATAHAMRYRDRSPGQESTGSQRQGEARRVPGQLAERARMLPIHGKMESSSSSPSQQAVRNDDAAQVSKQMDNGTSRRDEQSFPESSQATTAGAESWPEDQGEASLGSLEAKESSLTSAAQVKRKPKAELDKRSIKVKADEAEVPVEAAKVKGKRGRKPKVKENPLESPAPSGAASASLTKARAVPQAGVKRQRAVDIASEGGKPQGANGAEQLLAGPGAYGSDSDLEDFSQHKDMMAYRLEVHKRGQKVQKAYEAQTTRKRRKLHDKFLEKQEKRLEAKAPVDLQDDEGYLGTGNMSLQASPQPVVAKGRGRGRKKLLADGIKTEADGTPIKETKAEMKRRERKEAAEAAAMAQVQAIKAKARAQENELNGIEELEDEDADAHVPRSNMYDDESDEQDFDDDHRNGTQISDDEVEQEESNVVPDEETLARRQEREYEAKRRAIWDLIAHRQIREITKIVATTTSIKMQNCKKVAQLCQRESRKAAARSVKPSKDVHSRARKANREMLFFWKRNEREERELRKKAEKEAIEKLRIEEEMREARRQARKLNFLITQTELYSHFIGKKIGTEAAEADDDATPVRMQPAKDPSEMAILQDPNHTPVEGDLDFEKDSDETLEAQAKWGAQQALLAAQERTKAFDEEAKEHQERKSNMALNQADLDEMNFQNPSSMPTVTEIEQPKMLMCQLKGYQIKGLNWLANLYEQGINGILADEMGLGKTVQSISLMAHLAESQNIWGPFLVIAPASTLHNWQQEFTKFTPDLKALPYWGNMKDRKTLRKFWNKKQVYSKDAPFHVLITSYQLVVSDEKYFQRVKWQYMVLDEAQAIKSSSSARWKTLLGFNCRNRLLLTGTPIQNSMQELWALLHFIMPSLFDSHEEFSEWFSKDIESHAENKGTLNEHQLKRLHMILKPFMLRRIKKNVQNELGDKIELEVSCELTARQRALYRGLKQKISISELLEKASSLNDNDSVDSLMNLVMQFRKVCNHPELFERADVVSPLALCAFSQTPSIAREGDDLFVAYTTRSHITYSVPKRVYREGGFLSVPSSQSRAGSDTKYLDQLLNIWTPDHIAQSMYEEQGAFSFLRFADYSPSQASKVFKGHLMERFAQHLEMAETRSRRGYGLHDDGLHNDSDSSSNPGSTYAKFVITETRDPFSIGNQSLLGYTQQLGHALEKSELGEYLPMMEPAYRPKAVAPPIEMVCSDRSFLVDQQEQLFDSRMRQMLLGVPSFRTEASSDPENAPMMDLWRVNGGRGLLGEPSLSSMGYSTIEVPQMKQLVMDSGKLAVLDKLLVELKAGGHRVLVYFQMTKMIDLMEEYLTYRQYKYLRLDGSSKISDRRDMVTDWQTRPEIFIFLLSTRAGGLGINLTAADTVIFYDSDWNPTVDQQAMDRAHRLGQTRQVTVYRLITRGTIEERILQRAKQKDEIQKVVISGGEFKQSVEFKPREIVSLLLDDDELASKLQEQQLKRKVEEEEAKNSRKGGKDSPAGRPSKRAKKDTGSNKDSPSATTPASSGSAAVTPGPRSLDDMWAEMENRENGEGEAGSSTPTAKPKRGRVPKEKAPKEPKPKKEKEPKAKKPPKLSKKAQAAADAAAAAAGSSSSSAFGSAGNGDVDDDIDIDQSDM
ncbi:chromatin-remodeling ATPase INO80 [Entomortierella parvispora]|uniref:Chromatin-remodeling ATPase INO80 n=1 Tax=Entomortierella parvispora TaxID=205924 RepID=A0A9P3LVH4_9FUNG|nr:chromatin-remodeling ATPase INO80 [Entomortierella parvispora]